MQMDKLIIAIDFDETLAYKTDDLEPKELLPHAKDVVNELYNSGKFHIIIWTCRSGFELLKAKEFLKKNDVKYHDINTNIENLDFATSRKIFYDYLIDDKNLGTKIDWLEIRRILMQPKEEIIIQEIVIAKTKINWPAIEIDSTKGVPIIIYKGDGFEIYRTSDVYRLKNTITGKEQDSYGDDFGTAFTRFETIARHIGLQNKVKNDPNVKKIEKAIVEIWTNSQLQN